MLTKKNAALFDRALERLADHEFAVLRRGRPVAALREQVYRALDSLGGLASGKPPDYDDRWVALLYATWYLPGQVALASAIADKLFDARRHKNRALWIVDYGCGNLAMLFGVSLARGRRHRTRPPIGLLGIDPSRAMRRLGERLWDDGGELRDRRTHIASRPEDFVEGLEDQPTYATETWFIAMHAVYENNRDRLPEVLERFSKKYSPRETIVTCHQMHENLARRALPGAAPLALDAGKPLPFPRITAWRKSLGERLGDHPMSDFLRRDVDSGVRGPLVLRRRATR